MENKASLIELYNQALAGNHEAILVIIQNFTKKIYKNSYVNGQFNEDCFQELNVKLLESIKKFKIHKNYDVFKLEKMA